MYRVEFSNKSENQLKKLEEDLQRRIVKVLERITVNPEDYLERQAGSSSYKLRIGDYRLIVDLDKKREIIFVIKLGHRKNIYKF
ncbi:MAG: type II toxin-antitoxin system RelE/ParE family toxin [Candidatus Woesearchaeota archaeon]|nr:MAG: type II toxin-antitoxin system RelE/ParE family toxin [Candidatus Woesearchaeota archaeon]